MSEQREQRCYSNQSTQASRHVIQTRFAWNINRNKQIREKHTTVLNAFVEHLYESKDRFVEKSVADDMPQFAIDFDSQWLRQPLIKYSLERDYVRCL